MTTLRLTELERKIRTNSKARKKEIEKFTESLKKKNPVKGRIRPKDPIEKNILDMFSRK